MTFLLWLKCQTNRLYTLFIYVFHSLRNLLFLFFHCEHCSRQNWRSSVFIRIQYTPLLLANVMRQYIQVTAPVRRVSRGNIANTVSTKMSNILCLVRSKEKWQQIGKNVTFSRRITHTFIVSHVYRIRPRLVFMLFECI